MTAPDPARPASEREALARIIDDMFVTRVNFTEAPSPIDCEYAADAILAAGWRRDGGEDTVRLDWVESNLCDVAPQSQDNTRELVIPSNPDKPIWRIFTESTGRVVSGHLRGAIDAGMKRDALSAGRPIPTEDENNGR